MRPLKISFIVPVYNVQRLAEYFDGCMESLLAQTYANLEIILVNDASTDDTAERLLALQARDSRVRIITHTENKKQYGARNSGLDACGGDYVFFVDQDDYVYCRAAEIIAAAAESHGKPDLIQFKHIANAGGHSTDIKQKLSAANSDALTIKVDKNRKWLTDYFLRQKRHHAAWTFATCVWTYAFKLENAASVRFPLHNLEDLPYSLEIHALSQSVLVLNATLYYHRVYGDSISLSIKPKEMFEIHVLAVQDMDAIVATYKLRKEFPLLCRVFQLVWRCAILFYFLRYVLHRLLRR